MTELFITRELLNEIISHCRKVYPYEACGILAGKSMVVQKVYKMTNIENSGVSYMLDSMEQFAAMKEMREQCLDMTAIYHSHPHSECYPSAKDIRLAFYPDSLHVILSLIHEEPVIKAYEIKDGIVREVEIISILK